MLMKNYGWNGQLMRRGSVYLLNELVQKKKKKVLCRGRHSVAVSMM